MSILRPAIRYIYAGLRETIREAAMATQETRSRTMSSVAGAALALLGLAGPARSLDRLAIETLPSVSLGAWQISGAYLVCHLRVLEALLQISSSCWRIVVSLAGVA